MTNGSALPHDIWKYMTVRCVAIPANIPKTKPAMSSEPNSFIQKYVRLDFHPHPNVSED